MGQSQSHTASRGQPASHNSTTAMGKRITAPNAAADAQSTATSTPPPTLQPSDIRSQLKQLTASLTPSLIDAIKRRDEAAIAQFESLHSQLSALYSNPSLPDEFEVRVHELWNKAETLRTAMNVVAGLKERGKVEVSEMEGEDERDKKKEQGRARVEQVEREDREQRKKAIELQKLALRRAEEQRAARSKQSKLTGRVTKARRGGATNKPQQRRRKVLVEDEDEEDDAEEEEQDSEPHVNSNSTAAVTDGMTGLVAAAREDEHDVDDEEDAPLPPTKKTKTTPRSTRATQASGASQKDSQSASRTTKQSTPAQSPSLRTSTLTPTSAPTPRTYTRTSLAATTGATAKKPTQLAQPARKSPRKPALPALRSADRAIQPLTADSFVTPAAPATAHKHKKAAYGHTAGRDSDDHDIEEQRAIPKSTAHVSRLNLTRVTAAMTPERKKAQQIQQQKDHAEEKQVAGPGVGRTGKRRQGPTVVREEQHDIYDTFDG